ncbi:MULTISPECIES: helix-turn-helix domain-containing protein [Streptomyces violaceusniger group]|uniref:Helix-turn-helix transcriptional regulator n=2 Tax=Streptomyces violaceusniger group TaxID=2839105 RepID=A0ABD5JSU6_9ACTN|nr:helix-turn-helix transcriptional regulator [Streptomyces violaceusniger]KUL43672.1 XRE family transcriptional regulator [Streptomyces violaceusniger]MEE4590169.1 helix-turn-helix transcriptional regulator [Streptomyces sp. DSM 41602]
MSAHGTGSGHPPQSNSDLGDALRRWRDRVPPADVGLPTGRNRRAPGLRREELALLAGISAEYIVRLEQGRATSPSAQVLGALARALRLSEAERRHLFALAGQPEPPEGHLRIRLTPGVQRLVDQLPGTPVGVYDAAWTLLAWNRLYAALLGDPSPLAHRERNLVRQHFTAPPGRVRHTAGQQARFEAAVVSDLRATRVRYPKDAALRSLVADLRSASPRFAALWDGHEVGAHALHTKTVHHPDVGPLDLDCDILTEPGCDLRIVILTAPPGSDAASRLQLLDVIGIQTSSTPRK